METKQSHQVVFRNVAQVYFPQSRVECHYSLTAETSWSSRDWIGLFQVGWTSVKDYHTYVWANAPEGPMIDYTEGTQVNGQSLFNAYYLPSPGQTQYQFVYVDEGGEVRGQSGPFTFSSAPNPLVEAEPLDTLRAEPLDTLKEEQDGEDMLLVVSRATLLQSQLVECQRLVTDLQRALDMEREEVERQKESGRRARSVWEEERGAMKEVISELREKLRLCLEQLHRLEGRHQDVQYTRENMSSELSSLWTEKAVNQQKISELEDLVKTLTDRLGETDTQTDRMQEREKELSTQLKQEEEKKHTLQADMEASWAEVRELRDRLSSGEHVAEALRKELYEAGLQRDHTHAELHKARLHKAQLTLQMNDDNLTLYEARAAWALERENLRAAAEMDQKLTRTGLQQLSAELQQREAWLQEEREERQKVEAELTREREGDYRVQLNYARQELEELKSSLERAQKESQLEQKEQKPEEEEEPQRDSVDAVEEAEQKEKEVAPVIVLTLSSHREVDTPLEFLTDAMDEWRCSDVKSYGPPPRPAPALSDNDIYMW